MKKATKQSTLIFTLNLLSIFFLTCAIIMFILTVRQHALTTRAAANRFDLTFNANRFMNGSAYLTNEVRAYAVTGNQVHYDNYWNEVNTLKNREEGIAAMQEIGITQAEQGIVDEMSALSNNLVPLENEAMESRAAGNAQSAMDYVYGASYETEITKINQLKTELSNTMNERTSAEVKHMQSISKVLTIFSIGSILFVAVLQILVLVAMKRRVIEPIIAVELEMDKIANGNLSFQSHLEPDTSEIGMLIYSMLSIKASLNNYVADISEKLTQMADGNMDLTIDIDYAGDFSPIKQALLRIISSLNHVLMQINSAADEVSAHAEQVANSAQSLAQSATEQTSSVEKLTQSVVTVSEQTDEDAKNADIAVGLARNSDDQLTQSNEKMQEMLTAVQEIGNKSSEIGKVIKTIEDIAFQTNILALNAAVEAARAGAAGKGFAVVADEVRNLATKSAEAASTTTNLIQGSQQAIERGVEISDETAESLRGVIEFSRKTIEVVGKISESTDVQAQSFRDITGETQSIAQVIHLNSESTERSAAASSELLEQARQLRRLVGEFRLKGTGETVM